MVGIGPILMIVLLFCCCISSAGGAWYYSQSNVVPTSNVVTDYTTTKKPLKDAGAPKSKIITTYSASACQTAGSLFIDANLACNDGAHVAGITWNWGVDAQSSTCKKNCGGYIVTVVSSNLASIVLQQTIKVGTQTGAGIVGMPPPWYTGALTFTVMPIDKKGKKLLQRAVSKNVNILQDQAQCLQVGVNVDIPIPFWNENKNLIGVRVDNTAGNMSGYQIRTDNNKGPVWYDFGNPLASDDLSGFMKFGALALSIIPPLGPIIGPSITAITATQINFSSGTLAIVPKGYGLETTCDGHISAWQSWNDTLTWDYMMANGAAKKDYKFTASMTCWSGDALADQNFYAGW